MKLPPYRERTKAELRRAFRWAQHKLHVQNWTLRLAINGKPPHPRLVDEAPCQASVAQNVSQLAACVWLQIDLCKERGTDPLYDVLHELVHVALWLQDVADEASQLEPLWEQAVNRMTLLLYDLWRAEGNE